MSTRRIGFTAGQLFIAAIIVFTGLLYAHNPTQAQVLPPTPVLTPTPFGTPAPAPNTWSEPIAFDRTGWFPDITSDASGRLHIAWSNSVIYAVKGSSIREGFDIVLYTTSADGGKNWTTVNEIAAMKQGVVGNVDVTRPVMVVSPSGILHMTFKEQNIFYSSASAQAASQAQYWVEPQQVTTYLGYFSRLAVDSQGRLHMVYSEILASSDCMNCYHLFYRYSDDEGVTWSNEADVSVLPTGAVKPNLLVDRQDNIHLVWESGRGGALGQVADPATVMYAVSYNRGESWSQPLQIGGDLTEQARNITIGQDGAGNIVIVWWGLMDDLVFYQVSADNGLSWNKPTQIPNVWGVWLAYNSRLDTYSMATDSAGKLHLVMVGRTAPAETTMRLIHLTWDGTVWSFPDLIVSYQGDAPEWPRVAISNGNQLNVVWFVRGEQFIWTALGEAYKIWYSSLKLDAPEIAPVEFPQPVLPTLMMRDTPVAIETLTPIPQRPTLVGAANIVINQNTVSTEMEQLIVMAQSLIPALVIVGLLTVGIVVIRRR